LSYSLTGEALPDTEDTWTPAGPGPAQLVADALHLAITGGTVHLGRLLAAQGVLYVVVVDGLAPSDTSLTPSVDAPPPIGIKRAMLNQDDLQTVPGELGVQVYKNTEPIPVTAERAAPALAPTGVLSWPGPVDVAGWAPVLSALDEPHGASGAVSAGTVFAGYAPAGDFTLSAGGKDSREQPAFGWAAEYPSVPAGPATLSFHQFPFVPLVVLVELVGWVLLSIALLGWRPRRLRVPATREEP